jgi:hypothetical protein
MADQPPFHANRHTIIVVHRNHRSLRYRRPNLPEIIPRVDRDETTKTADRARA